MSNAMTEFRITTDLSALRSQIIDANFAEVREWLDENLAPYRDMAVSADDLSTAKTYRANIRKVKERIEQSRKEAKAAALEAYSAFEAKCKELTGLCDEAANNIDTQVKAFEDAEKQAKIAELRADYDSHITEDLEPFCPWERVFNPKWENKGYSIDAAKEEIYECISRTENYLSAIRDMGGDDTPYLLDVYKQTHDMAAVVRKASELKTMREREAARKREESERAAREAELLAEASRASHTPVIEAPPQPPTVTNAAIGLEDSEMITVAFKVFCTKAQLTALGQYMKQNGIRYGRVTD